MHRILTLAISDEEAHELLQPIKEALAQANLSEETGLGRYALGNTRNAYRFVFYSTLLHNPLGISLDAIRRKAQEKLGNLFNDWTFNRYLWKEVEKGRIKQHS